MKRPFQTHECEVLARLGAARTPASGALPWPKAKADGVDRIFRWELKSTEGKSIGLTVVMVEKVWREAMATGHRPGLAFRLGGVRSPVPQDWVIVDLDTFLCLQAGELLR